ncbi:methyltransferase domain-containing protein [Actinomycetospora rhizophila]|uniref:Methyltransferase domain-containing protein n=1 Tax=Actinomycetospora rhizophila TaxID=1416876 RepID=A0ABV9ZF49_9PSEU
MDDRAGYTIAGGATDADRLSRMSTVMADSTLTFLCGAGLAAGASCLDVGCRDGQVALDMAREVGASGRVVGVDADAGALEIARRAARDAGVEVTFLHADASREELPAADVDLAYARLLLSHLVEPMTALRAMVAAVRPGGVVAVEDLFTPTLHAEPREPALDDLIEVYSTTVRFHGGDPTIGPRLGAHLGAAGLVDVHERTVENRMTTVAQKMFLAQLLDNMHDAIASAGAATPDEVSAVRAAVAAGAERPGTVFVQARMHQVRARRPA